MSLVVRGRREEGRTRGGQTYQNMRKNPRRLYLSLSQAVASVVMKVNT